jgi:hypothetical protein
VKTSLLTRFPFSLSTTEIELPLSRKMNASVRFQLLRGLLRSTDIELSPESIANAIHKGMCLLFVFVLIRFDDVIMTHNDII